MRWWNWHQYLFLRVVIPLLVSVKQTIELAGEICVFNSSEDNFYLHSFAVPPVLYTLNISYNIWFCYVRS